MIIINLQDGQQSMLWNCYLTEDVTIVRPKKNFSVMLTDKSYFVGVHHKLLRDNYEEGEKLRELRE